MMLFFTKRPIKIHLSKKQREDFELFRDDFSQFIRVSRWYLKKKFHLLAANFEIGKNFLVDKLMWKRGRLAKPFLHTGLMFLLSVGIAFGPLVASKYPTLGKEEGEFSEDTPSSVLNTITASSNETTTEESLKPRDKIITHTVTKGETLSSIAKKYFKSDSAMALNTIRWENNLTSDELSVDQELDILPVPGIKHQVSSGETIYTIAKKYTTNSQKIVDFPFNYFRDEETFALNIDDLLIVPDGIKPQEKPFIPPPSYYAQMPTGGGTGEFIWPTNGEITQWRTWYHTGVDIANASVPNIVAGGPGVVSFVSFEEWGYGYHLMINHGTYQTLYGHLSSIDVSEGQTVSTGQVLGRMGSTGRSTGTHLHFEVRQGGAILNPMDFLK